MSGSSSSRQQNSLPPLHQAIPEFHSHVPQERRDSSIPCNLTEHTPSFKSPGQRPSIPQSYPHPQYPERTPLSPRDRDERPSHEVYDAQTYMFPDTHARRMSSPSAQPPYQAAQPHQRTPYFPPISSLTPSRGSSTSELELSDVSHPSHLYTTTSVSASPTSYRPPSPQYYSHPQNQQNSSDFERPGKRRRGNLPKQVTDLLREWLNNHIHHPYPTEDEKQMLMAQTGLTIHQISNWFINARRRRLPPINSDKGSSRRSSSGQL